MQIRAAFFRFYTPQLLYSGTAQPQLQQEGVSVVFSLLRFGVVTTVWGKLCICMLYNSLPHFKTSFKLAFMAEVSMR